MKKEPKQNFFDRPSVETPYTVINLGGGVQSSTMALMAAHGEQDPMPDLAIFADTQAEPDSVYAWLDWLEKKLPFEVRRVTRGSLTDVSLTPVNKTSDGTETMRRMIPLYGQHNGKRAAALGRKCTADYKVAPIIKEIRREYDIRHKESRKLVTQWIGISWDEIQRVKAAKHMWSLHRWPLIERRMTRHDCKRWMEKMGYPEPPRSACYYCPFHSQSEWRNLRDNDPEHFKKAVEFDKKIRAAYKDHDRTMEMEVFIHSDCKPLDEVDLDTDLDKGQQGFSFLDECEGMCGM